ncbi:C4-dicarboxylate transport transcriptional regulatory protein DctD [Roseobacter sp. SK209-2-6]|uniref:sigma-54-dependent transcriptional regulator n=1 Tax=Roseobacter sp. SK209-2-6 TaxID=388739 RepID=UPI0000F3F514|nr:sigma-54 dependent transcriptional regulator [Roseobacter sp. SK209-2-6]EBA14741.1 C4-dicarboxylate transport transcriptional regulatory protein DctD [Roseobacter sp. SK209-2-6]
MSAQQDFSILVADDDKAMRHSLAELLEVAGWQCETVARGADALKLLQERPFDVLLSDVQMPGMSGLELLSHLNLAKDPPLVLISAHGDIPMAVQAMQDGAYSFVEKPYEPRRLLSILAHAAEQNRMRQRNNRLKVRLFQLSGLDRVLLGHSPAVETLRRDILDLADASAPVLVLGETGTGKELAARALHDLGSRPDGPFLALNCAALSSLSFEEEMFGVHGGSVGRLQAASGGTLFLDEICSCPLEVQAKLLRVLEEKEILPVGALDPVPVDFRVVSATNEDTAEAVKSGQLRQDLLFRINTITLTLPPLRQRREDLMLLTAHFLEHYARIYEFTAPEPEPEDLAALLAHEWPGNVRELRNLCERYVLSSRRGGSTLATTLAGRSEEHKVPSTLREAVAAFERELISKAIRIHEGRMEAAAEELGIGRRTLNEKIVKLGLNKDTLL